MNLLLLAQDATPLAPPADWQWWQYALVVMVLPFLFAEIRSWRAERLARREKAIGDAAWSGYMAVNNQKKLRAGGGRLLDKAAKAETRMVEMLRTQGVAPTATERTRARLLFEQWHGEGR